MTTRTFIHLRGNTYHYVRRIPNHLSKTIGSDILRGKKLFSRSLRTSDRRKALARAIEFDQLFAEYTQDTDHYWHSLPNNIEVDCPRSDLNDWRLQLALEEVERAFGVSLEREPDRDQSVRLPLDAQEAITAIKSTLIDPATLWLTSVAEAKRQDLAMEGKASAKGMFSKIKSATNWIISHNNTADMLLAEITPKFVRDAIRTTLKSERYAPETLRNFVTALSSVWQFAVVEYDLLLRNPFKNQRIEGKSKSYSALTWNEVNAILNHSSPAARTALMIGMTTGARISEVADISCFKDKDSGALFWSIKPDGNGKTEGSTRVIPVHQSLIPIVSDGFKLNMSSRQISRLNKIAVDSAIASSEIDTTGDRKISFHSYRSTVISHLVNQCGFSEREVGLYTGHTNQKYQQTGSIGTYIQFPSKSVLFDLVNALPNLL